MKDVADMAGACLEGLAAAQMPLKTLQSTASLPWFALRVREKMREITEERLVPVTSDTFSPMVTEVRQWSDRRKVMKLPVFAGYLFAQFELDKRMDVLKVLGVIDLVRVGARPAEVDRDEIEALRTAFAAQVPMEPLPHLVQGQAARVIAGPMRGVEGTLALVKSELKLVLAVTMMNRSVAVEIDRAHVMPL
jgi:transcription antitermination factor NusG